MDHPPRGGGILVLVAVLVLGTLTFLSSGRNYVQSLAGITRCEETALATTLSKDGTLAVTTWQRQCGKGTDTVTHANLHAAGEKPAAEASGLIRTGEIFMQVGKPPVAVQWDDARTVTLTVPGNGPLPRGPDFSTASAVQVHVRRP